MNDHTATGVLAVTPNDNNTVPTRAGRFPRAFYVNGAGDVSYETLDGDIAMKTCVVGVENMIAVRKIRQAGTTATGIHVLY